MIIRSMAAHHLQCAWGTLTSHNPNDKILWFERKMTWRSTRDFHMLIRSAYINVHRAEMVDRLLSIDNALAQRCNKKNQRKLWLSLIGHWKSHSSTYKVKCATSLRCERIASGKVAGLHSGQTETVAHLRRVRRACIELNGRKLRGYDRFGFDVIAMNHILKNVRTTHSWRWFSAFQWVRIQTHYKPICNLSVPIVILSTAPFAAAGWLADNPTKWSRKAQAHPLVMETCDGVALI